jgi:uncharacterized Tic20 family protein
MEKVMPLVILFALLVIIAGAFAIWDLDRQDQGRSDGNFTFSFIMVIVFMSPLVITSLLIMGENYGRAAELCDQAEGVYSYWTSNCTEPIKIIELE